MAPFAAAATEGAEDAEDEGAEKRSGADAAIVATR